MKPLRDIYFAQLGISPPDLDPSVGSKSPSEESARERDRRKAALERAYSLRNFEIEHYWKRATYFWTYQAAMFVAFGALLSSRTGGFYVLALPVAVVGFMTALANVQAAVGSKFWQENWEKHIDMLEDEFEGRLHKTVWLKRSCCHPSVSKTNGTLGWVLLLFWPLGFVLTAWLYHKGAGDNAQVPIEGFRLAAFTPVVAMGVILISVAIACVFWHRSLTSVDGVTVLRNGEQGDGCNAASPLAGHDRLLAARNNPANEPDGT